MEKLQYEKQKMEQEKAEQKQQDMIERFKEQLKNSNLSKDEQAAMLAELSSKIADVGDMIKLEEQAQNDALADLLAKRRAKKNLIRDKVEGLASMKQQVDDYYGKKVEEIAEKEKQELSKIDPEISGERKKYLKAINTRLEKKRADILEESEKRLNEFRKKAGPEDYQFADMIQQYGDQVKAVNASIETEREDERVKMEEEL